MPCNLLQNGPLELICVAFRVKKNRVIHWIVGGSDFMPNLYGIQKLVSCNPATLFS